LFFARCKDDWLQEAEAKHSGAFYIKMSKLYIKKYSWHLADNQDLAEDVEDPPDEAANEVVHKLISEEEKQFRELYMKNMRVVSRIVLYSFEKRKLITFEQRLGQWYHAQYGSLLKSDKPPFRNSSPACWTAHLPSHSMGAWPTSIQESFTTRGLRRMSKITWHP
jgi:hypothetical protein